MHGASGRVARFFGVALAITWTAQLPAALATLGVIVGPADRYVPMVGVGLFGPTLAAIAMSRGEPGGVRALFARFKDWRTSPGFYLLAIAMPGALLTMGLFAYHLATGTEVDRWFWVPSEPQRVVAMLLFPVFEEIGWRGYAQPRLEQRMSPLAASVVVGAGWAVWHFPMFVVQRVPLALFALSLPFFVAGSVLFTWICKRSGVLLPMAIAMHLGAHLDNSMASIPGSSVPFIAQLGGFVVLAVALVAFDRPVWRPASASTPDRAFSS